MVQLRHEFCRTQSGGFSGFMLALIATLWAYDGWNDLTMVAGEVRRPERSLPLALIGGLFIVGVLFMATNRRHPIHPARRADRRQRAPCRGRSFHRRRAARRGASSPPPWPSPSSSRSTETVMSGARVPFAAARDRLFFRQFRAHQPTLPIAVHIAHRPGAALNHPAALPQPVPAAL